MSQNEEQNTEALKSTPLTNVEQTPSTNTTTTNETGSSTNENSNEPTADVTAPETNKQYASYNGFSNSPEFVTQPRASKAIAIVNPDTREIVNVNDESKKTEKDEESKKKEEEERIAAITAEKASRGPGRLDMSAIPPHVFHDSPVSTPTSPSPPTEPFSPVDSPSRKASILASPLAPPMRKLEDPTSIEYPPEFLAPKPFVDGKIAYEKTFMVQFQPLIAESIFDLSDFQSLMESHQSERRGTGRRQNSERGRGGPRTPSGQSMSRHGSRDGRNSGEMGKFASGGRQLSHRSGSNGPNSPMERQGSRNRSGRGGKGGRGNKQPQEGGPTIPLDQVVPLEKSENRWVATALTTDPAATLTTEDDRIPQEIIIRKVKSLLNKLTLEKFDSISDQIIQFALQSEKEEDGETLQTVINLIFDKAVDEAAFAAMWARLCRKLYVVVSENDKIKDVHALDSKGALLTPVFIFRRYLLNRCQREFNKGWKQSMPELDENNADVMMTDEYYAAAKKKRQGLGLAVFIGELYKMKILSFKIMKECLVRLANDPLDIEDAETETLCKLLATIGRVLETESAESKAFLDGIFGRMKVMQSQNEKLSSRVKFMIMDSFDLRKDKWVNKNNKQPAPTTIAQIHEQAKKANEEKESMKRQSSSRGPSSRPISRQSSQAGARDIKRQSSQAAGGNKNIKRQQQQQQQQENEDGGDKGGDGWSTVGNGPTTPTRSGSRNDMANFGKTERSKSRAGSNVLSPSASPFSSLARSSKSAAAAASAGNDKKSNAASGASSGSTYMNMFSALGGDGEEEEQPVERKKLELLPRSQPVEGEEEEEEEEKEEPAAATPEKPRLSDEAVARRSKNTIDEYFSLRDKTELGECIKELEYTEYRVIFAGKLLDIVEQKSEDVDVACDIITELYNQKLMQKEEYVQACKKFMEGYEDLIIDVPQASKHVDKLLAAMGIDRSEVEPEEI